jgi:rhodanese-related sulfurtransferase
MQTAHQITRDELVAKLRDPSHLLLDVLPRESFESSHIFGAVSLPLAEIPSRARAVAPDLARRISVYCGGPT